jgi:hypothetical protein
MIVDLQRRIMECGRIRIGQQVPTGHNGRTRPEKLGTFRITSSDRNRIEQIADLYGGTVAPWQAPAGQQWEVVTETNTLPVIVPPTAMAFSMNYELWSAAGCRRRCTGAVEQITQGPCMCDPEDRECSLHTRLSVLLRDVPGLGVYRLDTSGYNAAVELQGAVEVIQAAAGRGALLPARLRLEQRQVKRIDDRGKPQTRNFAVPVLDIEITPAQLIGGGAGQVVELDGARGRTAAVPVAALAPAVAALEAPRLTPVPAASGPGPSIADQVAPPEPKQRRRGSAVEIPRSGRNRRAATESGVEASKPTSAATDADAPDGDRMSQAQQRKLFALLRESDIDDRHDWASGLLGREVTSFGQLSQGDAARLIDNLEAGADTKIVAEIVDEETQWAQDVQGEQ